MTATSKKVSGTSVFVVTDFVDGGGYAAARQHLLWLEAEGIDARLISAVNPIVDKEKEIYFADRIMNLGTNIRAMRSFRKLWKKQERPRVISHGLRSAFLVFFATGRRPAFVSHGYNAISTELLIKRLLRRTVFQMAALWSSPACSVAPTKVRGFVFLPWPSPALVDSRNLIREDLDGVEWSGPLKVLWVGRLEFTQKRPDLLIESLRGFPEQISCRMIGTGPAKEELKARATQYGLNVEFIDSSDIAQEMNNCHVLVLLSNFEGVPFVLQEALSRGVPIIASPLAGNQWLCSDAALYAGSAKDARAQLQRMANPVERKRLSRLSRARWDEVAPVFQAARQRALEMARV